MLHLGVLAGVTREADAFRRYKPTEFPVTIEVSASDPALARERLRSLIAGGATHLISFGFAGGLDPLLRAGLVLLADSVAAPDGRVYHVDASWHEKALSMLGEEAPLTGRIAGSERIVASVAEKRELYEAGKALAVDMESHIVAETGKPFLIVRAVSDPADAVLPPVVLGAVSSDGGTSIPRLLAGLLRSPRQIPALIALAKSALPAERALFRCCSRGAPSGFGLV